MAVAGCLIPLQVLAIFYNIMAMIYYSEATRVTDTNNVDFLHTLSEITMARSKTWTILDKTKKNAWWDNMIGNNSVVSECKENK